MVVASGMARLRSSGKLLLIDAEYLGEAEGNKVFDEAPAAQVEQLAAPVVPQDKKSGGPGLLIIGARSREGCASAFKQRLQRR